MEKVYSDLSRAESREQCRRGFTLIELLVVIAIIGMLASVVVINVSSVRMKGRDAKRVSDLSTVASALQSYYADNHKYIITSTAWVNVSTLSGLTSGKYLSSLPIDPKNIGTNIYSYYSYSDPVTGAPCSKNTSYVLRAILEDTKNNPAGNSLTFTIRNGEASTAATCL